MNSATILIGNGLDISIGLRTSYGAFYKYVQKNNLHQHNNIYKAISKDEPEWWADFELGLGRFTHSIEQVNEMEREAWSQRLNEELDEIKIDLKRYVSEENKIIDSKIEDMQFTTTSLYAGLASGQVSNVRRFLPLNQQTSLRFVTLNYTNVLEKLFPTPGAVLGRDYMLSEPIHHVHGSIDRMISLGVNDESQLSSYVDLKERDFLIKPRLIQKMNDARIETMNRYINSTNLIVMFGLSIGATDKYIWEYLIDWLFNSDKLLIIHHFENSLQVGDLTERQLLQLEDRVKNKFLDYSDLGDEEKESLKSKIYVIPNSEYIFSKQ